MAENKNRWRPCATYDAYQRSFATEPRIEIFCDTETGGIISRRFEGPEYDIALANILDKRAEASDDIFLDDDTILEPTADEMKLAAAIAGDDLLQLSAIKYRFENGVRTEIETMDLYIKNRKPIDPGASKVNHITEESLAECNAPDEETAFQQIKAFFADCDVFVAYNEPFDFGMLEALYIRNGEEFNPKNRFDVMAMGIDLISVYSNIAGRKLGQTAKYLEVLTGEENLHNALDDIRLTVKVFEALTKEYDAMEAPVNTRQFRTPRIDRNKLNTNAKWVMWTWKNAKNHKMHRIYFRTSCGCIFFDVWDRSFGTNGIGKDANGKPNPPMYSIDELNMEGFLIEVLDVFGLNSLEELAHFKFDDFIAAHSAN